MKRTLLCVLTIAALSVSGLAADPALLGRASCATTTCHGGGVDRGPAWNHSLSTWIAQDPHASAGLLLRDSDSRSIVERLNPEAAESQAAYDNILRSRCISCHATPTVDDCNQTGSLDDSVLAEGVSCEACHGAAANWIDDHVRVDWRGPRRFEPESGMIDTESIIGRSETCVRCHIGSRSSDGLVRDMNHDLIAAGHPALRFDLLIYNENLPKHWDDSSEIESQFASSAVRVRQVGRAINLAAAASLSSERASDHQSDRTVPWPELADYDCFACHQSLSISEFQTPRLGLKSALHVSSGLPVWNSWHTTNQRELRGNRRALEVLSPHRSDPEKIATSCQNLASQFRAKAAERMTQAVSPGTVLSDTIKQVRQQPPVDWHQAAVQYLEMDAAARDFVASGDNARRGRQLMKDLEAVERRLRFDANREERDTAEYHSPVRFRPRAFQQAVLSIIQGQTSSNPSATN